MLCHTQNTCIDFFFLRRFLKVKLGEKIEEKKHVYLTVDISITYQQNRAEDVSGFFF